MEEQDELDLENSAEQIPDLSSLPIEAANNPEACKNSCDNTSYTLQSLEEGNVHEDWSGDLRLASRVSPTESILVCESLSDDVFRSISTEADSTSLRESNDNHRQRIKQHSMWIATD